MTGICLVSVCIPTYNRKQYLLEALNSVRSQNFFDYEIIVVDDGSNDGTQEMIESLGYPVRYYYQDNSGLAATRNKLIELAQGKYISFLDSDDLLAQGALSMLVQAAGGREDVCIYGDYIRIDEHGKKLPTKSKNRPSGMILPQLFEKIIVNSCGNLFPKKILIETGGFNVNLKNTPDYIKYLQLAMNYEFIGLNVPTFYRRRHAQNMSAARSITVLEELSLLERFYFNQGGHRFIAKPIAYRRLAKEAYRVAKLAFQEGAGHQHVIGFLKRSLKYKLTTKSLLFYLKTMLPRHLN